MPCFSKICESHTHLPGQHRWWWGLVFINLISLKKPDLDLTHSESSTVHINDCSFSQLAIWSHVAKVISNSYIPPWGWSVHTLVSGYARHQCARPHPRIIFELEVSSIYFNAVMIVFVQFWEKVQLMWLPAAISLFIHLCSSHTCTHMLYRRQKNTYLQRRWLKWCSNTQKKWENCSRNTSNHHLFT